MKTETITRNIYKFEELSKEVQQKVIEKWSEDSFDDFDAEMLTESFTEALEDEFGFCNADVSWSLSSCQGDGVSFTAMYHLHDMKNKMFLAEKVYEGAVPRNVKRILPFVYVELKRCSSSSYVHENTVSVTVEFDGYNNITDIAEAVRENFEADVEAHRVFVCRELEKRGYKEIEYKQSDEYIRDTIENGEYEFLEDGTPV